MTPAIQTCTAMVRAVELRASTECPVTEVMEPCGEPVAELGPCRKVMGALSATHWYCGHSEPQHDALDEDHDYQGTLTHVTLGCGWDDDGFARRACWASEDKHCEIAAIDDECPLVHHAYVPTVTERTDLKHKATPVEVKT